MLDLSDFPLLTVPAADPVAAIICSLVHPNGNKFAVVRLQSGKLVGVWDNHSAICGGIDQLKTILNSVELQALEFGVRQ